MLGRLVGLCRRQQLTCFPASPVSARTVLRTMFVNSLRLPGHHAEQSAEILHKTTPDLCRDAKAIKQRSKLLRCGSSLSRTSLPSRPVQQAQVLRRRYRQKSLVTAASTPLVNARTDRARSSLQFHRSQMTTAARNRRRRTTEARVFAAGLKPVVTGTTNACRCNRNCCL